MNKKYEIIQYSTVGYLYKEGHDKRRSSLQNKLALVYAHNLFSLSFYFLTISYFFYRDPCVLYV